MTAHPTRYGPRNSSARRGPGTPCRVSSSGIATRLTLPDLRRTVQAMGVEEVLTGLRSPWQNPFVERVIGSLRRECVDHLIVWNERSLRFVSGHRIR